MDNINQFYLINKKNKKINVLEGKRIKDYKCILLHIHGIGSHFQKRDYEDQLDEFVHFDKIDDYLIKHKIKSFALEFEGHGKSDGERCLVNNINDLVDDIEVTIDYLRVLYNTEYNTEYNTKYNTKIFIIAESMGGNVAIRYCLKNKVDGLILLSPMCGIDKELIPNCFLRNILMPISYLFPNYPLINKDSSKQIFNKKYNEAKNKCSYNYKDLIKLGTGRECLNATIYLMNLASFFKTPIIGFHDKDDNITNAEMTEQFINNCKSDDKTFVSVENSHHSLLIKRDDNKNNPTDILNKIIKWLNDRM